MKKLLTIAAALSAGALSYGQGYVNFSTPSAWVSTNSVAGPNGGSGPAGVQAKASVTTYYYALFVAPTTAATAGATVTGDPTTSGWTFTGDYATNGASKGNFVGYGPLDANSVPVPGFAAGATADFLVVGWSGNVGTTWAAAQAVLDGNSSGVTGGVWSIGDSLVGNEILAPAGGPYNDVLGVSASPSQIQGFVLGTFTPVPEPATFALAGLGAAALVIFRRRK
jgi:hypothetical protein